MPGAFAVPDLRHQAHPKLSFIPPSYNLLFTQLVYWILPFLMKVRIQPWFPAGLENIETQNAEILAHLYCQFQTGKTRLLLAFRHVEVDDPLCGLYLLSRSVPQAARTLGFSLQQPIHAHFIYERGMPLWAGAWLGWMLAKLGGIPIRRGRQPDWTGLRVARDLLVHGAFPLAVAPEGATNGHGGIVSPLAPGVAQLGFWGVSDLRRENRCESVVVVPIGIQYHYLTPPWHNLGKLLHQLEIDSGLSPYHSPPDTYDRFPSYYYQRLLNLGDHLLKRMEQFYQRFHHQPLKEEKVSLPPDLTQEQILAARLHHLLDFALGMAESYFALEGRGHVSERCRRIEEAAWTYIYRDDIENLKQLPKLERGLANWVAAEAQLRMLHMRLVESFVAVSGTYVQDQLTVERLCEMALLMFDVVSRIKGDRIPSRPRLGWRSARITVTDPISISDRWADYQRDRRGAMKTLTEDIQAALERTIL
jgi:1-acyl-sn-glycerol-3-phosphate acyltransferase